MLHCTLLVSRKSLDQVSYILNIVMNMKTEPGIICK